MLGVQQLAADGTTIVTTGAILVVPDAIGGGRVFVWNPNHWDSANWCSSESPVWTIVEGEGSDSDYPCRPNDIAILPRYGDWGYEINLSQDVSLGGLMIGSYMLDKDMEPYKFTVRGAGGDAAPVLTFARTDRQPAWIRCCPNGNSTGDSFWRIRPSFGDADHPIVLRCASDVELDLGWDGTDSRAALARPLFGPGCTLDIAEGKVFTVTHGSPRHDAATFGVVELTGAISGAGTFANRTATAIKFDPDGTDFTGRILEAGAGRDDYDRNAQIFSRDTDTLGGAALEIDGFVVRTDYREYPKKLGAGYVLFGLAHTWPGQNEIGNRLPGRAVILNGGRLEMTHEETAWSAGAKVRYETDLLAVSNGFSYVSVSGTSNEGYPETRFAAQTAAHANGATMYLRSNRFWINHNEYCERVEIVFPWFAQEAVGGIVPWIASHENHPDYGDWAALRFPNADADGKLYMPVYSSTHLADVADGADAFCGENANLGLAADKTVNSLVVQNTYNGDRMLGEGRTLTIASGGLILNANRTRIGGNEWAQTELSPRSGTLAFPGTAYVWGNNPSEDEPCAILSTIVAPGGLVSAMPGYLAIAGDQTGIDGELVVNAGTLTLGYARAGMEGADVDFGCSIDVPVRIVGGGARLKILHPNETTLAPTQTVLFDDVGGYAGKLDLPAGGVEKCAKCYVGGVTLARGTWGSSSSPAENVDDSHFAGTGVLDVLRDELARPLIILMR